MDSAFLSRYVDFNIKFDINGFAEWAESYGMENRCQNFALYYSSELFDPNHPNHLDTINPRSYTTFTNIISGIICPYAQVIIISGFNDIIFSYDSLILVG